MLTVDMLGYLFLFPYVILRRINGKGLKPGNVSRIAVFRLDGIGDLVLSGPALKSLRNAFPKAHITLFVNKWSGGIADLLPGSNETTPLNAPMFASFKSKVKWSSFLDDLRCLCALRKSAPFDLVIDMRGDFLSIVPAWCLGASRLAARPSRAGGFLLTNVIRQPNEGKISEVELNLNFVELLTGATATDRHLGFKPFSRHINEGAWGALQHEIGTDYVCLAVGAPYKIRCYPENKWRALITMIRREYNGAIVVLGGESDKDKCAAIVRGCDTRVFDTCGTFGLVEAAACISRARLVIGVDSGLIHVSSALKRPLVQLFGRGNSTAFGHRGPREHIIQKDCAYNPCAETRCLVPDRWCMERITPEEVFEVAKPYLR